jgi:Bacteriocin-protection, YdeI or OmpD-Associated/Domain of unknown function (DUF1905)
MPTIRTTLQRSGANNVGIELDEDLVLSFGVGKRVPVIVTLNGFSYRSTVAAMGGSYWVGVSAEHRAAAGVAGDEVHDVTIEHDSAPREVEVPDDFAVELDGAGLRPTFDKLAPSHRKEYVRSIEEAKAADTRVRRIAKAIEKIEALAKR